MIVHKLIPLFALGLNLLLLGTALAPDRKTARSKMFAYVAISLSIWNIGVLGLRWADAEHAALVWERVVHVGVIPIPVLFYHYVLVFLELPGPHRTLIVGYALAAMFLVASPTPAFMPGVIQSTWGYMPVSGPLYAPFFVYFQAYLVAGLYQLIRANRQPTTAFRRNRTRLVIFGVTVSLLGGVIDFLRFILHWDALYPIGIPCNAVFASALGIAIVRYRLFDLGILAKRIVLYVVTAAPFAPPMLLGLYYVERLPLIPEFLIMFTALLVAVPLLRWVRESLEGIIFQRQHGVRDALVALSKQLSTGLDAHWLGETLTQGLVSRIPALHASLHLYDPATEGFTRFSEASFPLAEAPPPLLVIDRVLELWLRATGKTLVVEEGVFQALGDERMRAVVKELEAARVAVLIPLFLEGELVAVLVLGEKVSSEMFIAVEIELLEMLIGQTAIALKNARLYEAVRAQMDELKLTQQQLVQSAKLAAIGELAAGIAHEINNPLTTVLGYTGLLLQQSAPGSPIYTKLTRIESEAERAAKIMRDLLTFSRRREAKQAPTKLPEVISRAVDLLHAKLKTGRVEVHTVFDPAVPPVLGDPDQLLQVFLNLVANAADAMPDGGTITVVAETREVEGTQHVVTRVIDRGLGIAPDKLGSIFDPFYTTKPEGQGTGLGLSMSLGIIKRHAGAIEVESEPGKGTTMIVTLPLGGVACAKS